MSNLLKVTLCEKKGFREEEMVKLLKGLNYLQQVVNSDYFKTWVLNFEWMGKVQFANNAGLTNEQVYDRIMSGVEVLRPERDNEMDIYLTIYNTYVTGRNVIGYTYPSSSMQYINRRFFAIFSPHQVAANLLHEWCHKIGFDHDFKATRARPFSVPYAVGGFIAIGHDKFFVEK